MRRSIPHPTPNPLPNPKASGPPPPTLHSLRLRLIQIARETPGQVRCAAAWAAANPHQVIFSTTRDFARNAGVSPATVIRMSRALGFCGFRSFREAVREASKGSPVPVAPAGGPPRTGENFLTSFSSVQTKDLGLNATRLNQIAERVMSANTVFVVGFRSAHTFAQYLVYLAHMAMPHFRLASPAMSSAAEHLTHADQNDLVIVFSVAPYAVEAVQLAYFLSENNIPTVAITDNAKSPFSSKCDLVLETNRARIGPIQSMAGCVILSEALLARCFKLMGGGADQKISEFENRVRRMRGYWPPE